MPARRRDVLIRPCDNRQADDIFLRHYWMKRIRRSRRLSYSVLYRNEEVAWIQCADPFGTRLAKPLQRFDIQEAVELCRGYFVDSAPGNIESCSIAMVLRFLPNDWYRAFGVVKRIAIVYQDLDAGQKGIVYKALGFAPYGRCHRARHHLASTRGNSRGNKMIWARGLRAVSGQHYRALLPKSDPAILGPRVTRPRKIESQMRAPDPETCIAAPTKLACDPD